MTGQERGTVAQSRGACRRLICAEQGTVDDALLPSPERAR
jgi:hypothetical protein